MRSTKGEEGTLLYSCPDPVCGSKMESGGTFYIPVCSVLIVYVELRSVGENLSKCQRTLSLLHNWGLGRRTRDVYG